MTFQLSLPATMIHGNNSTATSSIQLSQDDNNQDHARSDQNLPFNRGNKISMQSTCNSKIIAQRERKVLVQMGVLVVAFLICWLPFWVLFSVLPICLPLEFCEFTSALSTLSTVFQWLSYANSMINPVVYTIFNRDFRIAGTKAIGLCRNNGQDQTLTVNLDEPFKVNRLNAGNEVEANSNSSSVSFGSVAKILKGLGALYNGRRPTLTGGWTHRMVSQDKDVPLDSRPAARRTGPTELIVTLERDPSQVHEGQVGFQFGGQAQAGRSVAQRGAPVQDGQDGALDKLLGHVHALGRGGALQVVLLQGLP
ncbi:hypothetical protein TCAL_15872 [Tigriopus californicus]|uniref:G-protein coupled receptors family 1 profile domain-containing protein n=1 Tax=Tigriopus californicus TaxID=6832 RepID=A0A553NP57_TIGCA|nr:hypothetical protein TCAL_15872 [Tigriopus californicus]